LPEVVELIQKDLSDPMLFGNPGSLHKMGRIAEQLWENSLNDISRILRVSADELIVTSGGTESINTSLTGYLHANPRNGKHIISTRAEHKASLETLLRLEKSGYEVSYVDVDRSGQPDYSAIEDLIREDTALITLTHVNNETGAMLSPKRIADARRRKNPRTAIHLDCVQTLGKCPIDLREWGADMVSFSGHKIHCVKGVGLLYIKKGTRIEPLIVGGGQQRGMRSGTESPWLIRAFAVALTDAIDNMKESLPVIYECRRLLCDRIVGLDGIILSPTDASPYIVNASFGRFQSETLLHAMETHDVFISTISACTSKKKKMSHVLSAMRVPDSVARNAVRFSFSRFTTTAEISEVTRVLDRITEEYSLMK
jgi:cysteine desulfurase